MKMFGRCCFSIALLLLMVFASSSNASSLCHKFQFDPVGFIINFPGTSGPETGCSGCTGYVCKTSDGNYHRGSSCTDDVNEICQQGWDEAKINSIAQETGFQSENGKYFVFSCQLVNCNMVSWFNPKMDEYQKEIEKAGLSVQKQSEDDGIPKPSLCIIEDEAKRLNKMSNGVACPPGNPLDAKQGVMCQKGVCTCWEGNGENALEDKEVPCDKTPKFMVYECDNLNEKQKAFLNKHTKNKGCPLSSNGNGNGEINNGADVNDTDITPPSTTVAPGAGGAETIGNGFALLMVPLLASFLLF